MDRRWLLVAATLLVASGAYGLYAWASRGDASRGAATSEEGAVAPRDASDPPPAPERASAAAAGGARAERDVSDARAGLEARAEDAITQAASMAAEEARRRYAPGDVPPSPPRLARADDPRALRDQLLAAHAALAQIEDVIRRAKEAGTEHPNPLLEARYREWMTHRVEIERTFAPR